MKNAKDTEATNPRFNHNCIKAIRGPWFFSWLISFINIGDTVLEMPNANPINILPTMNASLDLNIKMPTAKRMIPHWKIKIFLFPYFINIQMVADPNMVKTGTIDNIKYGSFRKVSYVVSWRKYRFKIGFLQ